MNAGFSDVLLCNKPLVKSGKYICIGAAAVYIAALCKGKSADSTALFVI